MDIAAAVNKGHVSAVLPRRNMSAAAAIGDRHATEYLSAGVVQKSEVEPTIVMVRVDAGGNSLASPEL
jgi:hypothetical protein